jgi:predicted GNAT family acetyltransferase
VGAAAPPHPSRAPPGTAGRPSYPAPVAAVTYTYDVDGVSWQALKAALAADDFDNGRTPAQYAASHRASHAVGFAWAAGTVVGNARLLSDGVCNAYLVDVWTASPHRRQKIATTLVARLLSTVPGQHVALFTDDAEPLYASLGFAVQTTGMSKVVGTWLAS